MPRCMEAVPKATQKLLHLGIKFTLVQKVGCSTVIVAKKDTTKSIKLMAAV